MVPFGRGQLSQPTQRDDDEILVGLTGQGTGIVED